MDLTIATMIRPFEGEFVEIQRNSLLNWTEITDDVILVGDREKDADTFAGYFECRLIPCKRNAEGVKLVGSAINTVRRQAVNDWILFTGAETLYGGGVLAAASLADAVWDDGTPLLIIGQRHDLEEGIESLHPGYCIEYFLFRGDPWGDLPDFAAGRPGYDNCLVWRALHNGVPVIDATEIIHASHQQHGSRHRTGKLADRNRSTMRDECGYAEVRHATWRIDQELGVVKK